MYQPDNTHQQLMAAESALVSSKFGIEEARWASNMLQMLILAARSGETQAIVDLIVKNSRRVEVLPESLLVLEKAVDDGYAALAMARQTIPNTTPPHPGGLESCQVSDESGPVVLEAAQKLVKERVG